MRMPSASCCDLIESGYRLKIYEVGIMHRPLLHQNHQGGSTCDGPGLITVLQQELACFNKRSRLQKIERSNRHDGFYRN
jgi:hypothetical protein